MTIPQLLQHALLLHKQKQYAQAEALYQQVLALEPNQPDALHLLGVMACELHRYDMAIDLIRYALTIRPQFLEAHINLGAAFQEFGRYDQAIASYEQALSINPSIAGVYNNLGNALQGAGRFDEALDAYRKALQLDSDLPETYNNLGNVLKATGQIDAAVAAHRQAYSLFKQAHQRSPHYSSSPGNLLYTLHFHPDYNAQAILKEHLEWAHLYAESLKKEICPTGIESLQNRRIRIGYVSPDFRHHVVGRHMLPLLANHDHAQFEIFCYSDVHSPDSLTYQLQQHVDHWRDVKSLSDAALNDLIRSDRIDILVDLTLHMAGSRLLTFARKPAPVQATYLAYCSTSGLAAMNYRLSDFVLDPPGTDNDYVEQTIRLRQTYWCYQSAGPTPDVGPLPAATLGFVTFACLNNYAKVSRPALECWTKILATVPRSRLIIHCGQGAFRKDLLLQLARNGVSADQIEFFPGNNWLEYMNLYNRIDIALDPFPYGGGITSCDGLWMGVPLVTLTGNTAVGRGGTSILSNLALTELIARDKDQYFQIAVDLANDLPRLNQLRQGLRQRMLQSPLMDAPAFARDVEAAFKNMVRTK